MKKALKHALMILASVTITGAPLLTTVSCDKKIKTDYDFGLAASPINSLNYIRFKDTAQIIPSMVEGMFKLTTTNKIIQKQLNFPTMEYWVAAGSQKSSYLPGNFYDLRDLMGTLPGTAISSIDGTPIVALRDPQNPSKASEVTIQLGKKHKWSNGETVTAHDYIDTIKYILDINTGSQIQLDLLELGIKNAQEVVDAQNEYLRAFNAPYVNPFGYTSTPGKYEWNSQNSNDAAYVAKIKKAALGLGIFTKQDYHDLLDECNKGTQPGLIGDYHKEISWWGGTDDRSPRQNVPDDQSLFIEFDDALQPDVVDVVSDLQTKPYFLPINRQFVESHGGIQKYGVDKEHFLWNSAYTPMAIELGPAGYIELVKDPLYYNAQRTVSDHIKIYFQSDPMVLASMFEDGYIGEVRVPATHQLKFWSDLSMRPYLAKRQGFGTQAFALNTDTGNPALKDENFRKAIAYALNRNDLTKVANQEASFPVTTWTAFGLVKDEHGVPLETYFDKQTYKPYEGAKDASGQDAEIPIQSYPYQLHDSKQNQFERVNRADVGYNESYAQHFMDEYKKVHPGQSSITLTYIYNGEPVSKNIGIYLQSQLRKVFGGFVDVDIKGLPSNVFQSFKDTGNFDMLFYNFDSYGQEIESYVKRFFEEDNIDKSVQKLSGFKENPSGSWTYGKYFNDLSNGSEQEVKDRLHLNVNEVNLISNVDGQTKLDVWAKVKELSTKKSDESSLTYTERIQMFFNGKDSDPGWNTSQSIIAVASALEKLLREAMPVIPLMEIDTYWEAKSIAGIDSLGTFSLQTAYEVDNKPLAILPGIEALT